MRKTRLENIYKGFSCPQESLNGEVLELIASGYARELTARFVTRYGRQLDGQGDGLVAMLRDSINKDQGFEIAWDPAFGQIRKVLSLDRPSNVISRAAALGLRLHECGIKGQWELRLNAPTRLRMGCWLLPIADYINVQAGTKRISVQTRFQGSVTPVTFWRCEGDWKSQGAEGLPQVMVGKRKFILLVPNALDGMEFEEVNPVLRDRGTTKIVPALESAIALLHRYAPIYLSWVGRVVRNIVPLHASGSCMRSASETSQPGVIQMSFRGPSTALAEMLVHEGTHQYMSLLCQLGELDDGSDPTLYYSPIRQTGRPIRRILIAYHAFANVLLFYRSCAAAGPDSDQYCRRSEKILVPQLEQLEMALRTSRALTPLGRALWEPLAAQIH
jgi:HEXXH motif-containing protein